MGGARATDAKALWFTTLLGMAPVVDAIAARTAKNLARTLLESLSLSNIQPFAIKHWYLITSSNLLQKTQIY